MKLTKTAIEKMTPGDRDLWHWDSMLPGFGVRVFPSGQKSYVVRYRTQHGTQRKMSLGDVRVLDPDQAREKARHALASVKAGHDPATARKDLLAAPIVADLAERHTKLHAAKLKPGTQRNYETLWRKHILPRIGKKRVADITTGDIADLHADMGERPTNANRALELVSKAFAIAEQLGWRPRNSNPCHGIPSYPENERQRILTQEEIKAVMAGMVRLRNSESTSITWLIPMLLLTGLRVSEWSLSKWEWVNFGNGTLTLPDSKTGGRVVHLPDAAIELLEQMPRHCEWIFTDATQKQPLRWAWQAWAKIRGQFGLDDARLHDLRHTVGSVGHMNGLSQKEIAEMLGHRQLKTTERYLHIYDERKRQAANRAAAAILNG